MSGASWIRIVTLFQKRKHVIHRLGRLRFRSGDLPLALGNEVDREGLETCTAVLINDVEAY